jgi:lipopolysaccharide biosynthesis glycosyltransferase
VKFSEYSHIVISPDEKYALHGLTMLNSLVVNNRGIPFMIHILDGGISIKNKLKFQLFFIKNRLKYQFYKIDYSTIINAPTHGHISLSAYSRLFLSSILSKEIIHVLYLDCDLVVINKLDELMNTKIDDYHIAAIEEIISEEMRNNLELRDSLYFNSGVMLINLRKWREENIESKFLEFINEKPEKIKYWDQDVLNFCLKNKWLRLPQKYNLTHFFFYPDVYPPAYFGMKQDEFEKSVKDPIIIHFTSHQKPWIEGCKHPKKDLYFQYQLTFKQLLFGKLSI